MGAIHKISLTFISTLIVVAILLLTVVIAPISYAHPGRTDSSGCHTCRTNCSSWGLSTGSYHCHRSKGVPQPSEPIHSRYGEGGTGYTEPAPEYKLPTQSPGSNSAPTAPSVQGSQPSSISPAIPIETNNYTAQAAASTGSGLFGLFLGASIVGLIAFGISRYRKKNKNKYEQE